MEEEKTAREIDLNKIPEDCKIRPLIRKDRVAVSRMITKLADQMKQDTILEMIARATDDGQNQQQGTEEDRNQRYLEVGIELLKLVFKMLEDETAEWFADLLGISTEDLDNRPFDVELYIIAQLKAAPEFGRFFSGASQLFNVTGPSASTSQTGKTGSGSDSD